MNMKFESLSNIQTLSRVNNLYSDDRGQLTQLISKRTHSKNQVVRKDT